ncbi:zinc finger protein (macronuclear) [Tetrahymena thermophila SB210]|uniref:Zinc finger protein n=1 Tax=Tetrahymena thermophila (strain SB210) TaxID=312017 RepID=Q22SY7_TETTS|nr:zinc finger protein [Tetrahymena thermophila SB210]EAR88327.1 zinc finger protein [Tetrahymena thermophila SB210]|eukprot:XP_001008572.1 zinc finger protein [Tetrahymena thermophila SB210]
MKIRLFFTIIFTLASKIRAECSRGNCLPCSSSCQNCFSTSQDSCISCPQNYYKSNLNSSTCVQNCEVGEIQADNQQCIKCQIVGCIKCDSKQNCLQCSPNLYFDKVNNECSLKPKICQSEQDFIQEPFTKQQCVNTCPSSYYPNQKTQICEKISQCIQINDSPPLLNEKVLQLNSLHQDYYLIRANSCYFALVDQNFQIIYIEIFQNMPDFQIKYMNTGEEVQQKSFIFEEYGGCLANNSIKVMNFITKQIVFEKTDLDQDYFVQYIDYQNKIVFFNQKSICQIAWYDLIQYKFTTFGCGQTPIIGIFQIYILNKTNYYIQISVYSYQQSVEFNYLV